MPTRAKCALDNVVYLPEEEHLIPGQSERILEFLRCGTAGEDINARAIAEVCGSKKLWGCRFADAGSPVYGRATIGLAHSCNLPERVISPTPLSIF